MTAPFAFEGLDRVFHERARLAICAALLARADGASFVQLQDACDLTDGNLNRHLHALAEMQVVEMTRTSGRGRPQTLVRITDDGRERFLRYMDALEAVVRDVARSRKKSSSPTLTVPAARTSQ